MADDLAAQYRRDDLLANILGALAATGKDPEHPGPDDLMAVEDFHTLGRLATLTLAQAAAIVPSDHVLDAGCGIGGPARTLARTTGCQVTAVDLSEEFCTVAADLNARCGLAGDSPGQVEVRPGDITALDYPDATFDVAWTQHVAMNIADKAALYGELRRVLRPGGRLAFFDVVTGPNPGELSYPLPWADRADLSFLSSPEELNQAVTEAGFTPTIWNDLTPQGTAFWQGAGKSLSAGAPPPLGPHLLIANLPAKVAAMNANLADGRLGLLLGVAAAQWRR